MKRITLIMTLMLIPLLGISQNHSINFDGADDYVELDTNFGFENSDQFTVEAWINTSTVTGFAQIVSKLNLQFRGWGLQITDSGVLGGYLFSTYLSNQRYVEGTAALIDGTWHHVAMVFNGDNIALYVDGEIDPLSVDSAMGDLETIVNDGKTRIGNYDAEGFPGEFFNGNIDEVRIWNDVRTTEEIGQNYATEITGNEENLVGYYKMDEIDGQCDVVDCSPSAAHGVRNGASGGNNLPQFSTEIPTITDVECGEDLGCELAVDSFEALQLAIYPNPTSSVVSVAGLDLLVSKVTLVNVLGKQVDVLKLENNQLSLIHLPSGMYFLTVEANGQKTTKKIIKK